MPNEEQWVQRWLDKAENGLRTAETLITLENPEAAKKVRRFVLEKLRK